MKSLNFSLYLLLTAFLVLIAPANASGGLTGPTASTTGNYTIASVNKVCGISNLSYRLLENNRTIQTSCAIAKSFTGKPSGTYQYVLKECEYDSEFRQEFCMNGSLHSVIVATGGGEDPNGENDVRLGHYDGDGRLDIFVDPIVSSPYILRQLTNKSFQLINGLTSSQVTTYSSWTLATAILVHLSDFNADGADDLMLVDVSTHIAGADDQVVFSPYNGNTASPPVSVSPLTASKRQFLVETLGLSQDPDYLLKTMIEQGAYSFISHGFEVGYFNTAYLQIFQMAYNGRVYVGLNDNPYDQSQTPSNCAIYACHFNTSTGQWTMYVYAEVVETVFDYSIFASQSVVLSNEMNKVEAGTSTLDNLLNIIEEVVGPVSCDGIKDDQVDVFDSVHNFDYFKTNTCSFAVLARYLNGFSIKDIINDSNHRVQFRARKVLRPWFFNPFYHGSISNHLNLQWRSGFPLSGKLVGRLNDSSDDPVKGLTLLIGFINANLPPETVFANLTNATNRYDGQLPYCPAPKPGGSCFNSNSFAKGLVDLVGTIMPIGPYGAPGMSDSVDIPINSLRFPGIDYPLPASEFD